MLIHGKIAPGPECTIYDCEIAGCANSDVCNTEANVSWFWYNNSISSSNNLPRTIRKVDYKRGLSVRVLKSATSPAIVNVLEGKR